MMRKLLMGLALPAIVLVASSAALAQSQGTAVFRYSLWDSEMKCELRASPGLTFGTEFSLSDIGMDRKENIEIWEILTAQGKMQLNISYWESRWEGSAQITTPLVYENITYNVGDLVNSKMKLKSVDAALTFSLLVSYKAWFGLVLGVKYMEYYTELWDVSTGQIGEERAAAPLPYAGGNLVLMLGSQVGLGGRLVLTQYSYSGTNVSVPSFYEADAYLEVRAGNSLAAQFGVRTMQLNYKNTTGGDKVEIKHLLRGPYAAVYLRF